MQKTKKDGEQCHIGVIGLGRMGQNMAQRLLLRNVRVAVYDQNPEMVALVQKCGGYGAETVRDLVEQLGQPRAVWVMVPQGESTETVIDSLIPLLSAGDTIIDGGNAHYKDSIRRAKKLSTHGIDFLDVGTSGGFWGLE